LDSAGKTPRKFAQNASLNLCYNTAFIFDNWTELLLAYYRLMRSV